MAVVKFRADAGVSETKQFLERVSDVVPDDATCQHLAMFAELVSTFGQRTDLVSARTVPALFEVLFLDAVVLAGTEVTPTGSSVADIGAGAGAPAIPLALLREDLTLTLVEPRRRRVAFMRSAVGSLELGRRVKIIEGRDDAARSTDGTAAFDVAFSRATFAPEVWRERGGDIGHRVITLTADEPPAGAIHRVDYRVPSTSAPRVLAVFEDARPTSTIE